MGAYSKSAAAEKNHLGNRNDPHKGPEVGSGQDTPLGQAELATVRGLVGLLKPTPFPPGEHEQQPGNRQPG